MRHLREKDYQELLKYVREAKEMATMESASFCNGSPVDEEDAPQKAGESVTDFIRRRTKIWRDSWLIRPLEEAERILKEDARRD